MINITGISFNTKRVLLVLALAYIGYFIINMTYNMPLQVLSKYVISLIALFILLRLSFSLSADNLIAVIIILFPFPIIVNFGGKDLGSSITVLNYTLFVIYSIGKIFRKERILPDRPLLFILMYLILCHAISFLMNTPWFGRENALRQISIFLSCVIIFYMVINNVKNKRIIIKIIDCITIMCFLESLIIIFQAIFPKYTGVLNYFAGRTTDLGADYAYMLHTEGKIRIFDTIGFDFGLASEFFAVNIILQFFLIQIMGNSFKRLFYSITILFSCFSLVAIGTRGGFISLFIGLIITTLFSKKYIKFKKHIVLLYVVCISVILCMFLVVAFMPHIANIYERLTSIEFKGVAPDTRIAAWEITSPIILNHPWIGHGPQKIGKSGYKKYMSPHNLYLTYLFNLGIIGTSGIIVFFGAVFWRGFTALKKQRDSEMKYILTALLGAFVVFFVDSNLVEYLRSSGSQEFIWLIFGLIIAASRIAYENDNEKARFLNSDPEQNTTQDFTIK